MSPCTFHWDTCSNCTESGTLSAVGSASVLWYPVAPGKWSATRERNRKYLSDPHWIYTYSIGNWLHCFISFKFQGYHCATCLDVYYSVRACSWSQAISRKHSCSFACVLYWQELWRSLCRKACTCSPAGISPMVRRWRQGPSNTTMQFGSHEWLSRDGLPIQSIVTLR